MSRQQSGTSENPVVESRARRTDSSERPSKKACEAAHHVLRQCWGNSEDEELLRGFAITALAQPKQLQSHKQGSPAMPGPKQGAPAGLAGLAASLATHLHKPAGPTRATPAGPASPVAAQSRQRHRQDGAAAGLPGLMQGTGAGPAAAAGPCEGERGDRLCSDAGPSRAAVATGQQQETGARVGSGVPAAASSGAGSPADQDMGNRVGLLQRASAADRRQEQSRARLPTNGLAPAAAPAAAMTMARQPPSKEATSAVKASHPSSKDPTPGAPAAAVNSQLPTGAARLHGDGSAQPAAGPSTPGQGVRRPLQQLLVSVRRRISVNDRAEQLRQQEPYPGARQEAADAAALQAAAEAAGLRAFAAGPSARSEMPNLANKAAARTAAATVAHIAAQAPAVAAPAEAMPAAATPAQPRVSKRKAPSEEARPATQQEPTLLAASPAATSIVPDGAPRAAVAASEPASPAEQDTLPRPMQKCRHVGTAAFGSGQDALQSGQHLGTKASRPGFQAAAQARAGPTSRSGTSQAGSGLDVPARREQQAGRSGSPGASGSGPTMPAQSKQASGRNLHSSGSKASAPAPGIRGTATNDDCIDLSKLMMPAFRAPQTLASDLATNDVVIDLT